MITNRNYIQEQFCNYDIAVKLKELGFNMQCFAYYYTLDGNNYKFALEEEFHLIDDDLDIGKNCSFGIPLWQQAIDWFRENKNIYISIHGDNFNSLYKFTGYGFQIFKTKWNISSENITLYSSPSLEEYTYNNARNKAILKAIALIQTDKK